MTSIARPLLVVSDTHLGADTPLSVGKALAHLVDSHAGAEVILAGDVFDLSFAPRYDRSAEFLGALLDRTPELAAALRRRVSSGGAVTMLPGNHDAALTEHAVADVLRARLGVSSAAPVTIAPWFVRRGDLHVEHGHVYDPDNAPIHPLSEWDDRTEPLGVALTRRFVAAVGASDFSHAQDSTPVGALARAFRLYGPRAPGMIARYFATAVALCAESGPARARDVEQQRARGEARLEGFAAATGVSSALLSELIGSALPPTHLSRREVFLRLYFDRVFATLLLVGSVRAIPQRASAAWVALASFAYLVASTLHSKDRYGRLPEERLFQGACRVRELTAARTVVFGHTHHDVVDEGYVNTGSFAYPKATGRPYVHVDERGAASLRRQE